MKTRPQFSLLFLLAFILLVSLACLTSTKSPDATATQPPVPTQVPQEPTQPPVQPTVPPTEVPTVAPTTPPTEPPTAIPQPSPTPFPQPTAAPTEAPVVEETSVPYYTEEFDSAPANWSYFTTSGDEEKMDLYTENGQMVFDLEGDNQWVYLLYDDYIYGDVYLQAQAENRGQNDNNISLICRYTDTEGWYEFNVYNSGVYDILVYSEYYGEYRTLYDGGSKNIKTGRDTNVYSAICEGNELSLYINGVLERTVKDNTYKLPDGQVGIGVSSFQNLPIIVKYDYVMIDVP